MHWRLRQVFRIPVDPNGLASALREKNQALIDGSQLALSGALKRIDKAYGRIDFSAIDYLKKAQRIIEQGRR